MYGSRLAILLAVAVFVFDEIQKLNASNFLLEESFYLHQMLLVKKLNEDTKEHVQQALDELPETLKWFFEPEFCLLNAKYGEYLYVAGIDIDHDNRFSFTWVGGTIKANGGFVHSFKTDVVDGRFRVRFVLYNYFYRSFNYWKPQSKEGDNLIAAWKGATMPTTALWDVDVVNNNLVFSQSGRRMCASNKLHDEWRRFVFALDGDEYNSENLACQWTAKKCPFNQN